MASWIDSMTDEQLARENSGPGQVITRTPAQIAAYRAQQRALSAQGDGITTGVNSLSSIVSRPNQFGGDVDNFRGRVNSYLDTPMPVASQNNRFEAGLADAESRLKSLLDDPDSIKQSAAYKFRLKQGEDAVQRQMGARGILNSGNRLMELTKYGQDMGSQEYDAQAGRIKDLVGGYSGSWLGDKNANTSRFAAESNAWNQRGGVLSDLYGKAGSLYGQGEGQRISAASSLANMTAPQSNVISRSRSGLDWGNYNPSAIGGSTDVWSNYNPYRQTSAGIYT